jgi:hypothetical protein
VTKLFSLGLVIGISIFGATVAQAMPLAPLSQVQTGLTIPAAGGCGAGWHRDFNGICRPNVAPGAVVVAPGAAVVVAPGPCGGRGMHRVCNAYRCWRVCN